MRRLLAMQIIQEGKPSPAYLMERPDVPVDAYGNGDMLMDDVINFGKVGKWRWGSDLLHRLLMVLQ